MQSRKGTFSGDAAPFSEDATSSGDATTSSATLATPGDERLAALAEQARQGDTEARYQLLLGLALRLQRIASRMWPSSADQRLRAALGAVDRSLDEASAARSISSWAIEKLYETPSDTGLSWNRTAPSDQQPSDQQVPWSAAERAADGHRTYILEETLQQLSFEQREALLLRDVENLGHDDAQSFLDVDERIFRERVHRARTRLAHLLDERLFERRPAPYCPDVVLALSHEWEGEYGPTDRAKLSQHLHDCPSCAERAKKFEAAIRDYARLPEHDGQGRPLAELVEVACAEPTR